MSIWNHIEFADPLWLWALLILPVIAFVKIWRWRSQSGEVRFSSVEKRSFSWANLRPHLFWLGWLGLGCWMVAFARPRTADISALTRGGEGIDIMLAVDVSQSMLSMDLKPNRLEALKEVAAEFVDKRPTDRIGMVVYAEQAYTQTPLTTDHNILKQGLQEAESGIIGNSTAIGLGLLTAVNRIKESDAKSKVIILLTDGKNTSGTIEPTSAAQVAEDLGVRVYTIGLGTNGYAMSPMMTANGRTVYRRARVEIDEALLENIADQTGGRYFRAQNKAELTEIYDEIDRLEKSKIEELKFVQYKEHFYNWALAGLILLGSEVLLKNTVFRSVI